MQPQWQEDSMQEREDHQRQQDLQVDQVRPQKRHGIQVLCQSLHHEERQEDIRQQKPDDARLHRKWYQELYQRKVSDDQERKEKQAVTCEGQDL